MNLSKFNIDLGRSKNLVRWVVAGAIVVFLVAVFVSSYIKYKTASTTSTYQPAYSEDEGFQKLYQDLTRDKPQATQQKKALAEATTPASGRAEKVSPATVDEWVKRGGWKNTPEYCDSLRVQYAMLAFAFGKLVEENQALKSGAPVKKASSAAKTTSSAPARSSSPAPSSGFDFTQYFNRSAGSAELTTDNGGAGGVSAFSEAAFVWATLTLPQKQQVRTESLITFDVDQTFTVGGVAVPPGSKVSGIAQVSQGVGRVYVRLTRVDTPSQTMTVEGEVYSLDRSRGINVFVHGESALAEGVKRELTDWVGLFDPSRSGVSRSVLQDTDVGREFFATLDAGTMVLAKIRPGR